MMRPSAVKTPRNGRRLLNFIPLSGIFITVFFTGVAASIDIAFGASQQLPFPARASWGASTYAVGGTSAANVMNDDSFETNPAGLAYYAGKSAIGGGWEKLPNDLSRWSTFLADGTGPVVGGFQFSWTDMEPATRHNYIVDAVYQTSYGAMGVALQGTRFSGFSPGKGWHLTGTTGILVPVSYGISVGAYGEHFLDREKDIYFPPAAHFGVQYSMPETARLAFEASRRYFIPQQDWNYSTSLEYMIEEYLIARGGYHWAQGPEQNFFGAGLTLSAPKTEIAGMYMKTMTGKSGHGFGFNAILKF